MRRMLIGLLTVCGTGLVGVSDAPGAVTVPGLPCVSGDAYRVHVLYVRPPSAPDRLAIFKSMFDATVRRMDNVLNASAAETGNRSQHVRWVTDPPLPDGSCRPSITPVVLTSDAAAATFGNIVTDIRAQGFNRSDRKYFLFVDAVVAGAAQQANAPIQDTTANTTPGTPQSNQNNGRPGVAGQVGMTDVRQFFRGWGQPHELMHTLGAVLEGAPNFVGGAHVQDDDDVMLGAPQTAPDTCASPHQYRFDCGHDDYYSAGPAAGPWLPTHWNTADSAFLTPRTATQSPPANDAFANAQVLTGARGAVFSTSNIGATSEPGEPGFTPAGAATHTPRRTVWYRWTAPATVPVGFATYDKSDTDFHSALAVFEDTNNTLGGLVFKGGAASVVGGPTFSASARFQAETGKTYRIYIDGTDPAWGFGNISFRWRPMRTDPDFDADGRTDISLFRPSTGGWYVRHSGDNTTTFVPWGTSGDAPVAADYDADGKTDVAVFRPSNGSWYIRSSATNTTTFLAWGATGDVPVPADYDGDGKADIAVFRPSTGAWFVRHSSDNTSAFIPWGANGDVPVPGDWNNDTKADIAVFRPSTSTWFRRDVSYPTATVFGTTGDIPAPPSSFYSGTTLGVFRPSNGFWYGDNLAWGTNGDVPALGDWSGIDAVTEPAVFRPSTGFWFRWYWGDAVQFGASGDIPLTLPWAIHRHFFP